MFEPTILASILKNLCASVATILVFEMVPARVTKVPGSAVTGVVTESIDKSGITRGKVIFPDGLPPPLTVTTARHLAAAFHLSSSDQGI